VTFDTLEYDVADGILELRLNHPENLNASTVQMAHELIVLVPWTVAYVLLSLAAGQGWPLGRFIGAVAFTALFVVFHLALVLALSAVIGIRGAVLAIPLGLLIGADLVVGFVPAMANWMPYLTNRVAAALLVSGKLVMAWPVIATVIYTAALTGIALWSFDRREL
jgi:ABC-type transport system involved in multi-copper enzyme maturation permease subunit